MSQLILFLLHAAANIGAAGCYFITQNYTSFLLFGEPDFSELPESVIHRD